MELSNIRLKIIRATMYAAGLTIVFITGVTITADLYPPLKNWLKITFSHHWIGKGILAAVIFIMVSLILSLLPAHIDEGKIKTLVRSAWVLVIITLIGTLVITSFFIYEAFLKH
ncbi:MAG: hypothetical protein NUV61_04055 [Candidatus Azambacteria bacterium]|nr:hypothetical protein [Candidatus Azambacteria bacterium]